MKAESMVKLHCENLYLEFDESVWDIAGMVMAICIFFCTL